MNVLVLCDDRSHPAGVPRGGLEALGDPSFHYDFVESAAGWSAARMGAYQLVVLTKSNNVSATDETPWVTEEVQRAFVDHVRKGGGLLAVHSGLAGYRETPLLRGLLGGVFTHHPPQCAVTIEPREGHPLAAGVVPFTVVDEHYFMELDDPQADLLMTTTSEHGAQPGGWTRSEGQGRVCVLTPGHNIPVWLHPSFQALLRNALRWCAPLNLRP